jgi:WhiB family redox-sensing transcriptional regulator
MGSGDDVTVRCAACNEPFTVESGSSRAYCSQACAGSIRRDVRYAKDVDRSWQDRANCLGVDPELFFPERGTSTVEAKAVCRGCEVRMDCLEYALAAGEKFGIWGGMSERERRRIRRTRNLNARSA